ncbi:GTP pyrophosphokinase, partial [Agrobacterium vitis]|uniref:GTP pyrophosphokinase n=1 Tax=Agrobacterium vitis TaxID=373 RepID=UPI0012E90A81
MISVNFSHWIRENHLRFRSLTDAVQLIIKSLLKDRGISYLTVEGRTKSEDDCIKKVKRKNYRNPVEELTDISGIRIVVYFDYDVQIVRKLIEENFNIDKENSSNREEMLPVNEVGYRSVHYVCDLGEDRTKLQEHKRLKGLKFEFQVRTVLQHAWAELAHDRNYKFSGQLPKPIERKLFLLAGLMETADNGFSDLSKELDKYISLVSEETSAKNFPTELNSITLETFVKQWANSQSIEVDERIDHDDYKDLIRELNEY